MKVQPKMDETLDCSMCGECLTICPTKCLSIGLRTRGLTKEEAAYLDDLGNQNGRYDVGDLRGYLAPNRALVEFPCGGFQVA